MWRSVIYLNSIVQKPDKSPPIKISHSFIVKIYQIIFCLNEKGLDMI